MNRKLLGALLPALPLVLAACGGPLVEAEVKSVKITSTGIPFAGTAGSLTFGSAEIDLSPIADIQGQGVATELKVTQFRIAWDDPFTQPDFSGITSATLTAVADPTSGLAPMVVATYTQSLADPNPAELVVAGDPGLNLFSYFASGKLNLVLEGVGTPPGSDWVATATVLAEMSLRVEYNPM
jgi:hypothetical protein